MEWKDIAAEIGKFAPLAGTLIGGPAGAAIGSMISSALGVANTPDAVSQALTVDPEAAVKLRTIDAQVQIAQITAASAQVEAVNKTLQTEAMGGSFWQRNHHAFESTLTILFVIGVYFVLPLLHIAVPVIPEFAFMMIGGVLGVTAWQRGKANIQSVSQ